MDAPTSRPSRVAISLELQWPYKRHSDVFAGTQAYAREQKWQCFIDEFPHDTLPDKVNTGRGRRRRDLLPYDGIIARTDKLLSQKASKLKLPLVNVWYNSPTIENLPGVYPDFALAGRMRAEHLLLRGLRHFAAVGDMKTRGNRVEMTSFRDTVRKEGFDCELVSVSINLEDSLSEWRKSKVIFEKSISNWPSPIGVFVFSETQGRIVAQMCQAKGLRVPEDVAIIAGGNESAMCEHPSPSLTSMEYNYYRVGYEAARLLHQLIKGEPAPTRPIKFPPQGLIVRESTDFMAVDDELVADALSFIAANCHRRIGPEDVADAVNVESRTLQNRFRKYLDRPIAAEIRHIRIERAKRELAHGSKQIGEIAKDVGFGSAMRMYEVFRRELDLSPREYRKKHASSV